jgi:Glyoxalase-like domain
MRAARVSTRLDHVVLGVPDLSAGCADLAAAGLHFRPGGRHPGGTRNALLVAPEHWEYVELITAPEADASSADAQVADRIRQGGLVAWALSVVDIDAQVHQLSGQGFECQPVEAGARQTTDGRLVHWRSAVIGPGFGQGELPFLIEWAAADGHRTGLAPDGRAAHLTEIEVGVRDLDRIGRLLRVLGLTAAVADGGLECSDGAVLMRFADGPPRLAAVCLARPDGRRVCVTDRDQPRQLYALVDAAEEVG